MCAASLGLLLVLLSAAPLVVDGGGGSSRLARAREKARLLRNQQQGQDGLQGSIHSNGREELPARDDGTAAEDLDCGPAGIRYVSSLPAVGLHVIAAPPDLCNGGARVTTVSVYVDGLDTAGITLSDIPCSSTAGSSIEEWLLAALRLHIPAQRDAQMETLLETGRMPPEALEIIMTLQLPPSKRTWRLFTPYGTPLASPAAAVRALQECGTILCYEGGSFMWPGVEVGHVHTLPDITLTTLSLQPLAFGVDRLLSDEDCDWIIESSTPELNRAVIHAKEHTSTTSYAISPPTGHWLPRLHTHAHCMIALSLMSCELDFSVKTANVHRRLQCGIKCSRTRSHGCKPLRTGRTGCFVFQPKIVRRGFR
jgi:hypothetical protein